MLSFFSNKKYPLFEIESTLAWRKKIIYHFGETAFIIHGLVSKNCNAKYCKLRRSDTLNTKYNHILGPGRKCAILVSDMQRAYTEGLFETEFRQDKEIETIQKLLQVACRNNIPVIYTLIAFNDYEIQYPNIWLQKIPELTRLKIGSFETELDPRLLFEEQNSIIITKKITSSFFGTQLANQLRCQEIDTVIVTGCTTSGCVRATTVEGLENGFRMMVVKDAVADRWPEAHKQSLFEINAKYGDVIDSSEAMMIMKKK